MLMFPSMITYKYIVKLISKLYGIDTSLLGLSRCGYVLLGDVLRAIKRRETCRPSVISLTGERLSCYISYNIVTKPLLRHRVEQTGVSAILRRYGAAGREWLERLFL